jgi:hypothetical protein
MGAEVRNRIERALDKVVRDGAAEARESQKTRDRALENAERREWAHRKYGDERRAPLVKE